MGKIATFGLIFAFCSAAHADEGLNGLFGRETAQRRGAFSDSLANFNAATNPNSTNNYYQTPQQAFLSNLASQTSQSLKLPERRDPSEITEQFEESRKQAEESFKSLNEGIQRGIAESAKLDQLGKILGTDSEGAEKSGEKDSELLSSLSSLIQSGRSIGNGVSASADPYINFLTANTQNQIEAMLLRAQAQVATRQNATAQAQARAVNQSKPGDDFILGIEEVGASMARSANPFAATADLREGRDVAGTTDSFTPDSVDSFNRTSSDPHFGHNHGPSGGHDHGHSHGIGVPKPSSINADPRRGMVRADLGKRTYNFPKDVFPE